MTVVISSLCIVIGDAGDGRGKDEEPPKPKAWSNFDPSGLERAAKAARELDISSQYILLFICVANISHKFVFFCYRKCKCFVDFFEGERGVMLF